MKVLVSILALLMLYGCDHRAVEQAARARTGGDFDRGRERIVYYGCTSCHSIPGVRTQAQVGPPLDHIASRSYIGIGLINTPENMKAWISHPRDIAPKAAMPNMHINDSDARD